MQQTNAIVNLDSPGLSKLLSKRILEDIDSYCAEHYDDGHRKHLGASLINDECRRRLFISFRWVKHIKHSGRQQRLFNRGHREEDRFIEWLQGIGATVYHHDEAGNQFRVSFANGHGGGSLDGIIWLPKEYGIEFPILGEFKTNGTGKGFDSLLAQGVAVAKPMHYGQMSTYGSDPQYQFTHALYLNICKNDDNLYTEVVKLDWKLGERLRNKATEIINSNVPPPKISNSIAHSICKYCDYNDVCFKGVAAEKNCRSCAGATPVENKQWFCSVHNAIIPDDVIVTGCDKYHSIMLT